MRLPRRERPAPPADGAPARARAVATPGQLRRERRALVRAREERIRDLGGLMLEMYRRDRFREDLIFEQCGELLSLEARLNELDTMLNAGLGARRATSGRCLCGAPLIWGSHFCSNCGRAVSDPVVACARCSQPLPADAKFCLSCGTAAEAPQVVPALAETPDEAYEEAAVEAAAVEAAAVEAAAAEEAEEARPEEADPWER
jgi:hypothetical protein